MDRRPRAGDGCNKKPRRSGAFCATDLSAYCDGQVQLKIMLHEPFAVQEPTWLAMLM
jgi:hypothetical protein